MTKSRPVPSIIIGLSFRITCVLRHLKGLDGRYILTGEALGQGPFYAYGRGWSNFTIWLPGTPRRASSAYCLENNHPLVCVLCGDQLVELSFWRYRACFHIAKKVLFFRFSGVLLASPPVLLGIPSGASRRYLHVISN